MMATVTGSAKIGAVTLPATAAITLPPAFEIGKDKPSKTNIGVGIVRPYPTNVVTGDQRPLSGTIKDKDFKGLIVIAAGEDVTYENCAFTPDQKPSNPRVIVYCEPGKNGKPDGHVTLIDCTVQPEVVSWFTGVGNKNFTLIRTLILDCCDSIGMFATSSDPVKAVNIDLHGCYLGDLARFAPDYGGTRPETHNDAGQAQGNDGEDDDILFEGCTLSGYHSQTYGSVPPVHKQISALMLSPNTYPSVKVTARKTWFEGGVYTINGGATQSGTVLVLEDCIFEKPRSGGPIKAIALDPTVTRRITNCTYPDGTTVPVSNA